MKTTLKTAFMALAAVLMFFTTHAQMERVSPHLTANGSVHGATIKITYGAPSVKGRVIWGSLVPYDKPWRAGADEATTFETDKDIKVDGKNLPAGKYTLFITPGKSDWTFTFNKQTGQWGIKRDGTANFDAAANALVFKAKANHTDDMTEQLTYSIGDNGFEVKWEHEKAWVSIK